jgi:anti-sigma factor RsiW
MSPQDTNPGKSMLVTDNVIRDLVPLYFDGEASADSRALVEKWFATDPDFARSARKQSEIISALANTDAGQVSEEAVRQALRRAHRIILLREVSLGLAGALSLFFLAVGAFVVFSAAAKPHPAGNGILALTICFVLAATNWAIYFKVRRETGPGLP